MWSWTLQLSLNSTEKLCCQHSNVGNIEVKIAAVTNTLCFID